MLAYVFWHWPNRGIGEESYRDLLTRFHETLRANSPAGFLKSVVFSIPNLPWSTNSQPAFEDWYLVEDSAALDVINTAAVSGACEEPHNRVARHAAGGTAGLYRLRSGVEALSDAKYVSWFSKPDEVSYSEFYSNFESITSARMVGLWQRQMTLGPTTEFAIYSPSSLPLPENRIVEINRVWPE